MKTLFSYLMLASVILSNGLSAHSSHDKDLCKQCMCKIQKIDKQLSCCCKTINDKLDVIIDDLNQECSSFVIDSVPVILSTPGNYRIKNDLVYAGTQTAISVEADNVCIEFCCGGSLTVNQAATAILVTGVSDFSVSNGIIQSDVPSTDSNSVGIRVLSSERVRIDNVRFKNTRRGVYLGSTDFSERAVDVAITNCSFTHPSENGRAIQTLSIRQFAVENCMFTDIGFDALLLQADDRDIRVNNCIFKNDPEAMPFCWGLTWQNSPDFPGEPRNLQITNCSFEGYERSVTPYSFVDGLPNTNFLMQNCLISNGLSMGLNIRGVSNALVENCSINSNPVNVEANLVIGNFTGQTFNSNVMVKNCMFINRHAQPGFDNVLVGGPAGNTGVTFESCTFDANVSAFENLYTPANLHIGAGVTLSDIQDKVSDVQVLNCMFTNNSVVHLMVEAQTNNAIVENCLFDGATAANILLVGSSKNVIKNCSVTGSLDAGIKMMDGSIGQTQFFSQYNVIEDSSIQGNAGVGIVAANQSSRNTIKNNIISNNGVDGVLFDGNSGSNTIIDNMASNNTKIGFNNLSGSNNRFYDNGACANGVANYSGVALVAIPGTPTTLGQNLACALP